MGTIVLGKIEAGSLRKNQVLTLMPNRVSEISTLTVSCHCCTIHPSTSSLQLQTEVLTLWCDDEEAEEAMPGENIKIKLKNVEEEVGASFRCRSRMF